MKIVIMTGRFGMGHYAAAQAIMQQLKSDDRNVDIEIIDWFEYISPKQADRFYRFYLLIANKGSRLYNRRYQFREDGKTNLKPELSHYFMPHFYKFLKEKKPDLIISTLPFCSQMTSLYTDLYGNPIPLISCVTDITGHSEWINRNTGLYLVGSQSVKKRFVQKGVKPNQIIVTGIPVRKEFQRDFDNRKADHSDGKINILVMGGGLGILPEEESFYQELNQLTNVKITIITGKNSKLFHRLYGKYTSINVKGYVHNVYDYMKWADVIISKPGGVTIFEAIHSELPIITLKPCLQQEINNAKFLKNSHLGTVISGSFHQSTEQIKKMLCPGSLDYYRKNIQDFKSNLEEYNLNKLVKEMQTNLNHQSASFASCRHPMIP